MNKIFNWTFGSIFRTLGRIIAYIIIGIIAVMIFNAGGFKKPKISNILNDILFMKVNASEVSLTAKYNSTQYCPYSWSNSSTTSYDLFRYKEFYYETSGIAGQVYKQDIDFNTKFSTSDYDIMEIPFIVSTGVVAWYTDNDLPFPYCDEYTLSGNTYSCTSVSEDYTEYVQDSIKINNNNLSFLINYVGGGISACTYSNNVIVCPLTKNKQINSITFFISTESSWFNVHDRFYLSISQYINFYTYLDSSSAIINNATSNTQNIINNQNQNNQAIINNQNQNTQETINTQKVCKHIDKNNIKTDNKFFGLDGNLYDSNNYGITDFINILGAEVKIIEPNNIASGLCYYNVNKQLIGNCVLYNTLQNNQKITIPEGANFVRFTINKGLNKPQFEICQNGNQAMANTITDSNVSEANSSAGGFFNNFSTTDNGGLSSIITAPLSAIQSLTSASCSPLVLPLPFVNENLTLPCMRSIYESNFGGFMTLYDVITIGIISYWILVRIFNLVKDFKNPDHDEIEVVDL